MPYDHTWGAGGYFWGGGPLLVWIVVGIPFAIGFFFVAGRLGHSRALWAILSLIPIVNYFFWIYASFTVVLAVLDRLSALAPSAGRV